MKKLLLTMILFAGMVANATAQCAMCRSTLENNFSNGDPGIAAGINTGILYLLMLPYLAVIVIGILWYKTSRNGTEKFNKRIA
jgi:hypothetical protein